MMKILGIVVATILVAAMFAFMPIQMASTQAPTPAGFKVAFIGDQGLGSTYSIPVLQLIKNEGAKMVLHQGDFDYSDNPAAWDQQITGVLGADFPYFASIGNHDVAAWPGYQLKLYERLAKVSGAVCTGDLGVKATCTYQGLFFILSGAGTMATGHDIYIKDQLAQDNSIWRICSWHKNMNAMQVGSKGDSTGWGVYEECKNAGAIIATAHMHGYHRTKTLTSTQNQIVDPAWPTTNDVRVAPGASFVFVSGLGGNGVYNQERCLPTTFPYGCNGVWAVIYTSAQGAKHGALFCSFNVGGQANKAQCYFKNISGNIIDQFEITSFMGAATGSPDFTLSPSPNSLMIQQGSSGSSTITATSLNGFNSAVTLSLAGNPAGVTTSFSANEVTPPSGGSTQSLLTISVDAIATAGTYSLTVTGTSGALSHSTTIPLTILAPDFSLSASPGSLTIQQGSSGGSTITATSLNGFNSAVTLSLAGNPLGVTDSFSLNPVTPPAGGSASSTLTISVDASVATGIYTLTPTGVSSPLTHTASITLTVPDISPPVISNVQVPTVTSNGATITWTTDELSNSLVRYGTSTPPTSEVSVANSVTSHSVTLTGLSSGTTYFFEVQSSDPSGNTAIDKGGVYYSFTTLSGPVVQFSDNFDDNNISEYQQLGSSWTTVLETGKGYVLRHTANGNTIIFPPNESFNNNYQVKAQIWNGDNDAGGLAFRVKTSDGDNFYSCSATADSEFNAGIWQHVNDLTGIPTNQLATKPWLYVTGRWYDVTVTVNQDSINCIWTSQEAGVELDVTANDPSPLESGSVGIWLSSQSNFKGDLLEVRTLGPTVQPNQAPIANAGPDQTVTDADNNGQEIVTLNGAGSSDPDGTITSYEWSEGTRVLGTTTTIMPNFLVGIHTITLTVTDNGGATGTDTVTITVNQSPPPPPPLPTISINDVTLAEGNSGTTSFDFTVTRSGDTTGTSDVNFATADGTATLADSDYASNSGLLTFTAGQATKTVSVLVNGDMVVEPNEQFFVDLSNCVGCNITDPQGIGTITDDDSPPVEEFSDSFEDNTLNKWVQDSQNDWFVSTQRVRDSVVAAEVDGSANGATITMQSPVNLAGKKSATLTFSWFIESNWDSGEYICLDIFSNGIWDNGVKRTSRCLDGNVDAENQWHDVSLDLSSYLTSDFKIKFRAKVTDSSEDGNVDKVIITSIS